jgi:TPR repeat protein
LTNHGFDPRAEGAAAREWCKVAAEKDNADAQFVLGQLLALGLFGEADSEGALLWISRAADQGQAAATRLKQLLGTESHLNSETRAPD